MNNSPFKDRNQTIFGKQPHQISGFRVEKKMNPKILPEVMRLRG
jgi:hypothetical protein